jgi:hypothetical protein
LQQFATLAREHADWPLLARAAIAYPPGLGGATERYAPDSEQVALLAEALAHADDLPAELRALTGARYAAARYWSGGSREEITGYAHDAIELARTTGDDRTLARVLHAALLATYGPDTLGAERARSAAHASELIALADRLGDFRLAFEARAWAVVEAIVCWDLTGLDRVLAAAGDLASRIDSASVASTLLRWRATAALMDGDLDTAAALATEALDTGRGTDDLGAPGTGSRSRRSCGRSRAGAARWSSRSARPPASPTSPATGPATRARCSTRATPRRPSASTCGCGRACSCAT